MVSPPRLALAARAAGIVIAALAVARMAFVCQHADSYRGTSLLMLDLTDGGFSAMAGLFTAIVWLEERDRTADLQICRRRGRESNHSTRLCRPFWLS
jgi:hypothetical protein